MTPTVSMVTLSSTWPENGRVKESAHTNPIAYVCAHLCVHLWRTEDSLGCCSSGTTSTYPALGFQVRATTPSLWFCFFLSLPWVLRFELRPLAARQSLYQYLPNPPATNPKVHSALDFLYDRLNFFPFCLGTFWWRSCVTDTQSHLTSIMSSWCVWTKVHPLKDIFISVLTHLVSFLELSHARELEYYTPRANYLGLS